MDSNTHPDPTVAVLDLTRSDGTADTVVVDLDKFTTSPREENVAPVHKLRFGANLAAGDTLDRVRFSHGTVADLEVLAESGASPQDIGKFSRLTGADIRPKAHGSRSDTIGPRDIYRATVKVDSKRGTVDLEVLPAPTGTRGRKSSRTTL